MERDNFVTAEKVKNAFLGLEHRYHTLMQVYRRPVEHRRIEGLVPVHERIDRDGLLVLGYGYREIGGVLLGSVAAGRTVSRCV